MNDELYKEQLIVEEQQILDELLSVMSKTINDHKDIMEPDKLKLLRKGMDELYHTRIEVNCVDYKGEEEFDIKIGLHNCSYMNKVFICSWSDPDIYPLYIMNGDNTSVDVERSLRGEDSITHYTLLKKREVKIRFSKVKSVIQHFPVDEETVQLLYDSFLLELYRRHSDNVIRNIITSIQKEQTRIISQKYDVNLLIQGCAGSGKSMIMLHRLPVILKGSPLGKERVNTYIVSPSTAYVELVDNMRTELEISDLRMGTLGQYYDYCIAKYPYKTKGYGQINPLIKLDPETVRYIYSADMIKDINDFIGADYEADSVSLLKAFRIFDIEEKKRGRGTASSEIADRFINVQHIIDANEKVLRTYHKKLCEALDVVQGYIRALTTRKQKIIDVLEKEIGDKKSDLHKMETNLLKGSKESKEGINKKRQFSIEDLQSRINELSNVLDSVGKDREYFEIIEKEIILYEKLVEPFRSLDRVYEKNSTESIYDAMNSAALFIGGVYGISWVSQRIEDKYESLVTPLYTYVDQMIGAITPLRRENSRFLDYDYYTEIRALQDRLSNENDEMVDRVYINMLKKIGIEPDRKGVYRGFAHSPYIYLQVLYSFYGRPNAASERFMAIDEAQNLAVEELKLIENINGNNVILNLFGDEKQHVEGSKGVDSWNEFDSVLRYTRYDLNQNYRNAKPIVDYCNLNFGSDMTPISVPGSDVVEIKDENELLDIVLRRATNEEKTGYAAIIVKNIFEADYIIGLLEGHTPVNNMTKGENTLHRTRWNVMLIDDVKGLEFKSVIVVSHRLTDNEKYIAYTRALDELTVYSVEIRYETRIEVKPEQHYVDREEQAIDEIRSIPERKYNRPAQTPATNNSQSSSEVYRFFSDLGLEVIDNRHKGGYLCVIGERPEIQEHVIEASRRFGIQGKYAATRETMFRNGWITKTNK